MARRFKPDLNTRQLGRTARFPGARSWLRYFRAAMALSIAAVAPLAAGAGDRPNILWITCEDISPNLGCYGDAYAVTPNLDRLAAQGVLYTHAYAPIGVCAPARSCLITGMYPPSIGTQHMRCQGTLPAGVLCFPEYLRKAGYYCTNNSKTDYNFPVPKSAWDESSRKAHWRNRADGQPFFAIFNFTSSHESQIRLPEEKYRKRIDGFSPHEIHDPQKAPLPPYHPDTPEVRKDWARYYDMITYMDRQVAGILDQLAEDGLAGSTIVFFYSDHGAGMPRSKRWLYDSSTRVPMIVRFPERYQHLAPSPPDSTTDRLVSFVDFGPTVLSLAGIEIPRRMQGQAFLGGQSEPPRQYVFGFRDRMDERIDMIRSVSDGRYRYIRNYMPQLPYFQHQYLAYQSKMPTMRVWQDLADRGQLSGPALAFMKMQKPVEELYDTPSDPWEVHNLADDPALQPILWRMRRALGQWMTDIGDLSLLPEADLRTRFGGEPPYDAARRDPSLFPLNRLKAAADLASRLDPGAVVQLMALLDDPDPAVRYWAATGLGALGKNAQSAAARLIQTLDDPSPSARLAAADALCRLGRADHALPTLQRGLQDGNEWVRVRAANIIDRIDEVASPLIEPMKQALKDENKYVVRVMEHAVAQLGN